MSKKKKGNYKKYEATNSAKIKWSLILFMLSVPLIILSLFFATRLPVLSLSQVLFFFAFGGVWIYFILSALWHAIEIIWRFAIIITPKGLWFHGYGKRFYAWDNLQKFDRVRKRNRSAYIGIQTKDPDIKNSNSLSSLLFWAWVSDSFIPIELVCTVPRKWIFFFDKEKFKQTELGQDLLHYAPHLFEDKTKRKNRLVDDSIEDTSDIQNWDSSKQYEYITTRK